MTATSLHVTTGAELGTQVWVGSGNDALDRSKFKRVHSYHAWMKPRGGGLWTAQWHPEHGGGWVQWCMGNDWDPEDRVWPNVWRLEPEPQARVLVVDTFGDLERVCERWPHKPSYPSRTLYPAWEQIAEDFDAFHLTERGEWETRIDMRLSLYGWDCESTLWFRWAFASVERLGARHFTERVA